MSVQRWISALLAACVIAAAMPGAAWAGDNQFGTAVIKGKVVYVGDPPKVVPLKMTGDAFCSGAHSKAQPDQGTIVYAKAGNTIPYVFVYVKRGISGKYDPPKEPAVIDQRGCVYHPHVFGMVAGQALHIKNSDPTNHNIHSLAQKNPQFNFAQPNAEMVKKLEGKDTFTREEVMVKIKCDVHAWMSTYAGVLSHPFFSVTKSHDDHKASDEEKGTFEIARLPAGEYEIEAWHEKFGTVTQKVSVNDGETKEIEIKMGPGAKAEAPTVTRTIVAKTEGK